MCIRDRSYADALDEITAMAKQRRIVFVIDEYPYLAKEEKSISSRLQHIIDHVWQETELYLILCGSSMSFMEYQVLGYESPLYGRRTAQFKIQALTYREITVFHPELSLEDQAMPVSYTHLLIRRPPLKWSMSIITLPLWLSLLSTKPA